MTLKSGPFNGLDKGWDAYDWAAYFKEFIGNGVFPNPSNNLQVVEHANMRTKIKVGVGFIEGHVIRNPTELIMQHDIADGVLKRIDRIVMRVNYLTSDKEFVVKKGTFASAPVAPSLTRNADYYECALADVYITNGATVITQANITDQRLNNSVCGIVHGVVNQVDTTTLALQYQAAFQQMTNEQQQEFEQWFEDLQDLLDDNVAANLASQISVLRGDFNQHLAQNNAHTATNISFTPPSGMTATNVQDAIVANFTQVVNGKGLIATAINDKGGTASSSDTFAQLANAIDNISTGKKFARGYVTSNNSAQVTISGLDFSPSTVILRMKNYALNLAVYAKNVNGNSLSASIAGTVESYAPVWNASGVVCRVYNTNTEYEWLAFE